jgi:nucleotide-binding universal stress UspA family protein
MLQYKKILAPVDFAEISNSALRQAADHSEQSQSELLVAHVVDWVLPDYASDSMVSAMDSEKTLVRQAELHLEYLLDELEIGYCEKIVRTGKTIPALLDIITESEVDLVVMGTHRRAPVSERYKSVTMAIIEKADCDVLVLHK